MNDSAYTYQITEQKKKEDYYKFMENISYGVKFDKEGFVTEKQ